MKTVHLCIDLQHGESGYFQDDKWEKLVKNAFTLKRRLNGVSVPTIHVGYIDTRTSKYVEATMGRMDDVCYGLIKTDQIDISRDYRLAFDIPVKAEELVAIKPDYSVTSSSPLMSFLKENSVNTVILSGVFEARTPDIQKSCVTVSAATLARRGFRVIIAAEATNAHTCRKLPLEDRRKLHTPYGIEIQPIDEILPALVQEYHARHRLEANTDSLDMM